MYLFLIVTCYLSCRSIKINNRIWSPIIQWIWICTIKGVSFRFFGACVNFMDSLTSPASKYRIRVFVHARALKRIYLIRITICWKNSQYDTQMKKYKHILLLTNQLISGVSWNKETEKSSQIRSNFTFYPFNNIFFILCVVFIPNEGQIDLGM